MSRRSLAWLAAGTIVIAVAMLGAGPRRAADDTVLDSAAAFGLPPLPAPSDGVADRDRIELGRKLFFDRRLSFNGTMSCAMCHVPEEGFTSNASRTAVGIEGKSLRRNAPTVLNVAWQSTLFHDGRESSLPTQAWMPLLHPDEMANPSIGHVLQRIRGLADYDGQFERVFRGAGPSMDTLGAAIAAFESTLVAGGLTLRPLALWQTGLGAERSRATGVSDLCRQRTLHRLPPDRRATCAAVGRRFPCHRRATCAATGRLARRAAGAGRADGRGGSRPGTVFRCDAA